MDAQLREICRTVDLLQRVPAAGEHVAIVARRLNLEIALYERGVKRSPTWPKVRAAHLRENPTCAATGCDEDLEVHHIIPFHKRPELELERGNLITLSGRQAFNSHFWIGHSGNWKSYNPHVVEDAARMLQRIKERLAA